jgi:hypothetical protein
MARSPGGSRLGWRLLALLPLLVVPVLFVAVLRAGAPTPLFRRALPDEPFRRERCTWYCHNHGCRHRPVLPRALAGDEGLFGATIHGLYGLGAVLVPGRAAAGYGAANLLVFCVLWPGGIYALYLVALAQRRRLRARRRGRA